MTSLFAVLAVAFAAHPAGATDLESAYAQQSVSMRAVSQAMQERQKQEPWQQSLQACEKNVGKQPVYYGGWDLRMVTETAAYYTHQDCDICDSLDMCDLKTHRIYNLKTAHAVTCDDINGYRTGRILYANCPAPGEKPASRALLSCTDPRDAAKPAIAGTLDLSTLTLADSRSGGNSRPLDVSRGGVIDDRCGSTRAPLAESVNFEVTPSHYWGQDVLQLPKAAVIAPGPGSFPANLHLCQYDGDWSSSEDVALRCTLTR